MLYKVVITFEFVGVIILKVNVWSFQWKLSSSTFLRYCLRYICCTRWFWLFWDCRWSNSLQMKAIEQHFLTLLFAVHMQMKAIIQEYFPVVLSVIVAVFNFRICGWNTKCDQMKDVERYFPAPFFSNFVQGKFSYQIFTLSLRRLSCLRLLLC